MVKRTSTIAACALGLAALGSAPGAGAGAPDPYDGNWHFHLMPYLWLPNLNASLDKTVSGLRGGNGQALGTVTLRAETDPGSYLKHLKMAAMLIAEARKGSWSLFTDIMYVDFGAEDSRLRTVTGPFGNLTAEISRDAELGLSSTIWTLAGGYTLIHDPAWSLDMFAGARYLDLSGDLSISLAGTQGRFSRSFEISANKEVWDGIVGVRGEFKLGGGPWFVPYYLDMGAGADNWTWQAFLGVGYRFDWGEVTLAMRSLAYGFDEDDLDLRFTGPGLGVGFRW
jgi:hypothetical protein